MLSATALSYLAVGFIGAVILIYFVLMSTHAFSLLMPPDVPSQRPPAPMTVGGLGFAIPVIGYLSLLARDGFAPASGLLVGCAILVAVGLWGETRKLNPGLRFGVQMLAVIVVLWFGESLPSGSSWVWVVGAGIGIAVLWHVNRFGLLDHIDGFAGVYCVVFCIGVQVLALGIPGWIGDLTWLLAGSGLGFLVYNWPPAKILMGSAGSMLLGLLLAIITLELWRAEILPLVACLILLAGFWFDALWVACVKLLNARRKMLYETLADRKGPVWAIIAYVVFAICWLMPFSWLTLIYTRFELLWLVLAVLPMIIAARILNTAEPAPDEG